MHIFNQANKVKATQAAVNQNVYITLCCGLACGIGTEKEGGFYTACLKNREKTIFYFNDIINFILHKLSPERFSARYTL